MLRNVDLSLWSIAFNLQLDILQTKSYGEFHNLKELYICITPNKRLCQILVI